MKRLFFSALMLFSIASIFAVENAKKFKLYGFVRNDFYYNSRVNEESTDGLYNFFPKPANMVNGVDLNETPNSEMLSAYTRLGLDITGEKIQGAEVSAKIEADFAGTSTNYYLMRIRQAYINLNWEKSSLLIGQAWHPMFLSMIPTMVSINTGTPFQPFNRSPQVTFSQNVCKHIVWRSSALYQNQYTSTGPLGYSSVYLKNSILPNIYTNLEFQNKNVTTGLSLDYKRIAPSANEYLNSASLMWYAGYNKGKLQLKYKGIYGQNLSDQIMIGGYALAKTDDGSTEYTNFNTLHQWVNVVYGKNLQVGVFAGSSLHLGSNKELASGVTAYGRGYYSNDEMISHLWRVAPFVSKTYGNLKFGLEYNFTRAAYGTLQTSCDIQNTYNVDNHRVIGLVMYAF